MAFWRLDKVTCTTGWRAQMFEDAVQTHLEAVASPPQPLSRSTTAAKPKGALKPGTKPGSQADAQKELAAAKARKELAAANDEKEKLMKEMEAMKEQLKNKDEETKKLLDGAKATGARTRLPVS